MPYNKHEAASQTNLTMSTVVEVVGSWGSNIESEKEDEEEEEEKNDNADDSLETLYTADWVVLPAPCAAKDLDTSIRIPVQSRDYSAPAGQDNAPDYQGILNPRTAKDLDASIRIPAQSRDYTAPAGQDNAPDYQGILYPCTAKYNAPDYQDILYPRTAKDLDASIRIPAQSRDYTAPAGQDNAPDSQDIRYPCTAKDLDIPIRIPVQSRDYALTSPVPLVSWDMAEEPVHFPRGVRHGTGLTFPVTRYLDIDLRDFSARRRRGRRRR